VRTVAVGGCFFVGDAWTNLRADVFRAGPWPVEVSLVPEKPVILLGEPTALSFVVRNLSTEDLQILVGGDYENELGRPASFQVRVKRRDGRWVDQPKVGFSRGGLIGPKPLPAGETYVFRLFLPHWATFETHGEYTVSCNRTLQLQKADVGAGFAKTDTTDVVVEAQARINVEPRDPVALGKIINQYGGAMLRAGGEQEGDAAVLALAWMDDPRVVPYFARVLAFRSYALKYVALHALGKFATDEAFAALQAGMRTKAADLDSAVSAQAIQSAANIRVAAAGALLRCQHRQARDFLIAQRRDEAEGVRIIVLHAAASLPADRAIPIFDEMTNDPSPRVRHEAARYLKQRNAEGK
jgi:hypothetical protein